MEVFRGIIAGVIFTLFLNCGCHYDLCGSGEFKCVKMHSTDEWGSPIKHDYRNEYILIENGDLVKFTSSYKDTTLYSLSTMCENQTIRDIAFYNENLTWRNFFPPFIADTLTGGDYFILVLTPTKTFKFDIEFNLLGAFGYSGSDSERLIDAVSIDIDHNGNSYIVDRSDNSIKVFDNDGLFKSQWTTYLDNPLFLKVYNNVVYVLDRQSNSIKKYDYTGVYSGSLLSQHSLYDVVTFAFENNKLLWLVDMGGKRVSQIEIGGRIKEVKYDYCFNDVDFQFERIVSIDADVILFIVADYESKYILNFGKGPVD